jgi:uncharacterized protein YebE (UPF0316 family)
MEEGVLNDLLIPLFIFLARICDVGLGTMRIIHISRGNKLLSATLGFIEILIWLFAIQQIMQNLNNIYYSVVYAAGYAMGTFSGMFIEQKMIKGKVMITIITNQDSSALTDRLATLGYKTTVVKAKENDQSEHIILTIADRKNSDRIADTIDRLLPESFYSIEDLRLTDTLKTPHHKKFNFLTRLEAFKHRSAR